MSTIEAPPRAYPTRGAAALVTAPQRRTAPIPAPPKRTSRPGHLRVVRPTDRVRRRLTPAAGVVLTGVLFAMLFAIAIAHALLVQGQVRLDHLDSQLTAEQARYQELRKQRAEMESPARVVAAAQALGMVAPDDLVYLQPQATVASATASPGAASPDAGSDWSAMKPLLEAPAP
jgi:cell division protein FtsL